MKRILALLLAVCMILALAACATQKEPAPSGEPAGSDPASQTPSGDTEPEKEPENLTATQKIIKEAEGMTLEELA